MDQRQRSYRLFGETALRLGAVHTSLGVMAQDSSNVDDTEFAWRGASGLVVPAESEFALLVREQLPNPFPNRNGNVLDRRVPIRAPQRALPAYQLTLPIPVVTSSTRLEPERIESHSLGYFGTFFRSSTTVDVKLFHERIRDRVQADVIFFFPASVQR